MESFLKQYREHRKERLMAKSCSSYQLKENEMYDANLAYVLCKTCHKPLLKRTFNDEIGKDIWEEINNRVCDCVYEKNSNDTDKQIAENNKLIMNNDMYLRSVGEKFKDIRFSTLDKSIMDDDYRYKAAVLLGWCDEYKPGKRGWSLIGDVGLGKSTLSGCVRNSVMDKGFSCVMATTTQIVNDMCDGVDSEGFSFNTYRIADVLIIDDIGAEFEKGISESKASLYNGILFDLINSRYVSNKTTCFTSNITRENMGKLGMDKRIVDRFSEMIEHEMFMEGESLRSRV